MKLYLCTTGDGSDGDEWYVQAIFTTKEAAELYVVGHNKHRPKWAAITNEIEEWETDLPFNPAAYPNDPPKQKVNR